MNFNLLHQTMLASANTGDNTPVKLYIILAIIAGILMVASIVLRILEKKKK